MPTPSEIAEINARHFDASGNQRRKPKPPAQLTAIDLAIKDYVERKADVVALRTTDKEFRAAESRFRTAGLILKNHLRSRGTYLAQDGNRYSYSRFEDAIHIVPPPGRPKKGHVNFPVVETVDAREMRRQEFAHRAAEDHAAFAAEKLGEGGRKC